MLRIDWRKAHDFIGSSNEKAVCVKCDYTVKGKGAKFKIDKPQCSVRSSISLKAMLKEHNWYGLPPRSWFYVHCEPFRTIKVDLEDYLWQTLSTTRS